MSRALYRLVDVGTLSFFRIVWGIALLATAVDSIEQVTGVYSPGFHFRYFGFEWVPTPPSEIVTLCEIAVLFILALGVTAGMLTRFCLMGYGVIYLHLFLIDQVYYNNHFYLTILICFLLACTGSDRAFSLKSLIQKRFSEKETLHVVPIWQYWIFRVQLMIVYFYGGIAKLNPDWIRGEPLRYWFVHGSLVKWPLQSIAKQEWFIWLCSYGGVCVDLVCPFLLIFRKTRWMGVVVIATFHLVNSRLFSIGLFPFLGVLLLIPFFDPPTLRRLLSKLASQSPKAVFELRYLNSSSLVSSFLAVYFMIQVLVPLRHLVFNLTPSWTEVGHYFSWRMMLRNKDSYLDLIIDSAEAEKWFKENALRFPRIQLKHLEDMPENPWFLLQYVQAIDHFLEKNGFPNTSIRAVCVVSLNGRPYQVLIDPSADLTEVKYSIFKVPSWIISLDRDLKQIKIPLSKEEKLTAIQIGLDRFIEENPNESSWIVNYRIRLRN